MVFFDVRMTAAREFALVCAARDQFVMLDDTRWRGYGMPRSWSVAMHGRIRMDVGGAIDPGAAPRTIVDDHDVIAPAEVRITPSPRTEECANGDAEPKADRRAHREARTRSVVDDTRIVNRHDDEGRIDRLDVDVTRITRHYDLLIGSQIAKLSSLLTLALNGVHY